MRASLGGKAGSEGKTEGKLHHTGVPGERGDLTGGSAAEVVIRLAELRGVGHVEDLPTKFKLGALIKREIAEECGVEDVDPRTAQGVSAAGADYARRGEHEGVAKPGGRFSGAFGVANRIEPAVNAVDVVDFADNVDIGDCGAIWIERGITATAVDGERAPLVDSVNTGGLEAADKIA